MGAQGGPLAPTMGRAMILRAVPAAAFAAFVLAGCAAGSGYSLPEPIGANEAQIPADATAAAAAIVERLRGGDLQAFTGVRFARGVGDDIAEPGFAYEGFSVGNHALLRHGAATAEGSGLAAAGQLEFSDVLGRRTTVLYYTGYRLAEGGLEITEARASTLFSTFPECLMFVVPASVVAGIPPQAAGSHAAMLQFVAANAARWDSSAGVPPGKRDYVIFVFVLDRISPSAVVEVKLSENETGLGGFKKNSRYMDVGGWRIGIVPDVRFDLGDADFFVKVVFTPGEEVGFAARQPRLIGLFPVDLYKAQAAARERLGP